MSSSTVLFFVVTDTYQYNLHKFPQCAIIFIVAEAYRSGHNEAVLKTVWVKAHGGSNPSASAIGKRGSKKGPFFLWRRRRACTPATLFHNATDCTRLSELLLLLYSIPLSPPIAVRRIPPFHPANIVIRKRAFFAIGGGGDPTPEHCSAMLRAARDWANCFYFYIPYPSCHQSL